MLVLNLCINRVYFECLGMKFEMRTGELMLKGATHAQRRSGAGESEKLMEGTAWETYAAEVWVDQSFFKQLEENLQIPRGGL